MSPTESASSDSHESVPRIDEMMGCAGGNRVIDTPNGRMHVLDRVESVRACLHDPGMERLDFENPLFGRGLAFTDGAEWLGQRRIIQPVFHERCNPEYIDSIRSTAGAGLARMQRFADDEVEFDGVEELTRIAIRGLYEFAFGLELPDDHDRSSLVFDVLHQIGLVTHAHRRRGGEGGEVALASLKAAIRRLRMEADRIIDARLEDPTGHRDLLSQFMDSLSEGGRGDGERVNLQDQILSFFFASSDTVANSLSWLLMLLVAHPEECDLVTEELDGIPFDQTPDLEQLARMPRLEAAIREAQRLFPPVWNIPRMATRDAVLGNHEVRRGEIVQVNTYLLHRNPEYWTEPDRFKPQRFIDAPDGTVPYSFLPFGGGRHLCVGKPLAHVELRCIAAALLKGVAFSRHQPVHFKAFPGLGLSPIRPVRMSASRRRP
ncbi:MAG: cytochrome P450 [Phycisphaera sp.]|nr:cytochrome P450 [Phycisphaera sp.]